MTFDNAAFWDDRYRAGKGSGDGSYGKEAQRKADYVNAFLADHQVGTVLDFGCGDGNQLDYLRIADSAYLGTEVSMEAVRLCRERHPDKKFVHRPKLRRGVRADLTISLDVVFHQIEVRDYVGHLCDLFGRADRFVVIHSTNVDDLPAAAHVKHRWFTPLVAIGFPGWELLDGGDGGRGRDRGKRAFYTYARRGQR